MRLEVTTQPESNPLTFEQCRTHMRLIDYDEVDYVTQTIEDATAYFETEAQCSIAPRTLTATYYDGELFGYNNGYSVGGGASYSGGYRSVPRLHLPRGPVQSITSVTFNGVTVDASTYQLRTVGNTDYVAFLSGSIKAPVVITYVAGYASTPKDVRRALLQLVSHYYENREAQTRPISYDVANGLARVLELYRRTPKVG